MSAAALQLDAAISDVWRDFVRGVITEAEADHRTALLAAQRLPGIAAGPLRRLSATGIRKFAPRRYQRSPDREASRHRRRVLARDGHMPPDVRAHYTEGECAVLTVIAGEVKRQGVCDWPIDKIAAVAAVCRTTAQNAMRRAARLQHITVQHRPVRGRKSLTNVIRIVSQEWRTWIERGPGTGFKTISASKFLNSTKNIDDDAGAGGAKKLATEICDMVGIDPLDRPPGWLAPIYSYTLGSIIPPEITTEPRTTVRCRPNVLGSSSRVTVARQVKARSRATTAKNSRARAKQCLASPARIRTTLPGSTTVLNPCGPGETRTVSGSRKVMPATSDIGCGKSDYHR
jgi:hypothetical protein